MPGKIYLIQPNDELQPMTEQDYSRHGMPCPVIQGNRKMPLRSCFL